MNIYFCRIGKGTGYKSSELQDLQDGNTLVIGGKEIEIMGCLDEGDYKSGKCFNAAATKEEAPTVPRKSNGETCRTRCVTFATDSTFCLFYDCNACMTKRLKKDTCHCSCLVLCTFNKFI